MIKFKNQDGNETEQSYDLEAKTTVEDLQEILKAAVDDLDDDNDYVFYHNTFEVSFMFHQGFSHFNKNSRVKFELLHQNRPEY